MISHVVPTDESTTLAVCRWCRGKGVFDVGRPGSGLYTFCEVCEGQSLFGIDPRSACLSRPGTAAKVAYMVARNRAGLPLFHAGDAGGRDASDDEEDDQATATNEVDDEDFEAAECEAAAAYCQRKEGKRKTEAIP